MYNSQHYAEQMRSLHTQMNDMNAKAANEKRGFNSDENTQWSKLVDAYNDAKNAHERAKFIEEEARQNPTKFEAFQEAENKAVKDAPKDKRAAYDAAFLQYIRGGHEGMTPETRNVLKGGFVDSTGEVRTQVVGTNNLGGYLVNTVFGDQIIMVMKNRNAFMSVGNVITTTGGNPFETPSIDETAITGERLGEATAANKINIPTAQLVLGAHKYGSGIMEFSSELVQDNNYDVLGQLSMIAGNRIGDITGSDMTKGHAGGTHIGAGNTGLAQSATASGVSIAADTFTYDKLVDLRQSVDQYYRSSTNARWCFNDTTLGLLMKMKDSQGLPIWMGPVHSKENPTILGHQYIINNYMPDSDTAGNEPVLFGDFNQYYIRQVGGITMKRSEHRYFERDVVAYYAVLRIDAKLAVASAIKSLTVSA